MEKSAKPSKLEAKKPSKTAKAVDGDIAPKVKKLGQKEANDVLGGLAAKRVSSL
jgi:hypothetical protein